jgi:hypothetical protein
MRQLSGYARENGAAKNERDGWLSERDGMAKSR